MFLFLKPGIRIQDSRIRFGQIWKFYWWVIIFCFILKWHHKVKNGKIELPQHALLIYFRSLSFLIFYNLVSNPSLNKGYAKCTGWSSSLVARMVFSLGQDSQEMSGFPKLSILFNFLFHSESFRVLKSVFF